MHLLRVCVLSVIDFSKWLQLFTMIYYQIPMFLSHHLSCIETKNENNNIEKS